MNSNEHANSAVKAIFRSVRRSFLRLWRRRGTKEPTLREAIEEFIENDSCAEVGSIAEDEREILENVLDLRDTQIQEIMVPRVEIVAMSASTKVNDAIELFITSKKSTIIVYQDTLDNVIGVVHIRDIVCASLEAKGTGQRKKKAFKLKSLAEKVLFVPPTMRTLDLLVSMKMKGIKIAIIVDEYGDVSGLVSLHDLMEEIIGDMQDTAEAEYQRERVTKASDGSLVVNAKATFDEILKYGGLEIEVTDESIETIGGLLLSIAGRVPMQGEKLKRNNLEFEILDADMRSIKKIKIRRNG